MILKMTDLDLKNKRVLIREDFNVPIHHGKITSNARIQAALFTIEAAHQKGAKIILMSHLGRPTAGQFEEKYSLRPVADALADLLKHPIQFVKNWMDGIDFKDSDIVLCENVRFLPGEKEDNDALAQKMAALADVYVMDAFGSAHRAHASTHGVAKYAPIASAGPLLTAELEALSKGLEHPERPLVTIVGGSKVSTKLGVLEAVIKLSDYLIVGGGIANTFLAAKGYNIGKSLYEADLIPQAKKILAQEPEMKIPLPIDVIVAKSFEPEAKAEVKLVTQIADDDMILDVGPETSKKFHSILVNAQTIIWNGPIGVFEDERFAEGTKALALAIADSDAFSIAGGGDTLAAAEKYNVSDKISYISTGGGAFLEFLQGKKLPAVAILEQRALLKDQELL